MALNSLKNKKIIISAGASGIGLATAKICLSRGAYVYICDIDINSINKLNKHPLKNKRLFTYNCDASKENEVINFFKKIKKKTKKIDGLINNVGIAGPTGTLDKLKSKDWEKTIQVDINSHFYFTKLSIPMIKKSKNGSIINISSTAGILGFPLRTPYAASKWAIVGITKSLAMELGKFNIRVNAVCPGTIKGSRMKRVIKEKAKFMKKNPKNIERDFISMSSMKKWILEEDIGKMCAFLISEDSSKVSGQVIAVDGHTERND
ncbi:MAG: SDR family oxidoreductase [Candidatus Pelagibacterales bacterium]|nr:short-chain dehydrogenase [Candidatus Pelagibacter sp.]RZO63387.1 MAG: SDR family oxidoreductase [Pelagibacterales bacterium]|tara:strand:+ start:2232 stop:3020 length:789 start_codon:yes stop_codon:yes gene_type:complete